VGTCTKHGFPILDRYFGESLPFRNLTAETLQYLNVPQAIGDNNNFALNVKLPFATSGGANADKAPWVLVGGSYPGALTAWNQKLAPGVFAAYHASSAVVEAIDDFHTYYAPIEAALPRNCSSDIKEVIAYIDMIFHQGNHQEIAKLKDMFGLEGTSQPADFAVHIAQPIAKWQSNPAAVFKFCDYIETAFNNGRVLPGFEEGVGLDMALEAYATWVDDTNGDDCDAGSILCDSYHKNIRWNDPTDLSGDRAWFWMLCVSERFPALLQSCFLFIKTMMLTNFCYRTSHLSGGKLVLPSAMVPTSSLRFSAQNTTGACATCSSPRPTDLFQE
jgi:hypothetical protein